MANSTPYNSAYFNMEFEDVKTFDSDMQELTAIYSSDHKKLKNRDAEDQHPIEAITGLSAILESKQDGLLTDEDSGIVIENNYIKLDDLILNCGTSTTVI